MLKNSNEMTEKLKQENERLRRALSELSMLNDIARVISSTMEVDKILETVLKGAIKAADAEQGSIMLISKESDAPLKTLIRGMDTNKGKAPYRLGTGLSGWMIKNQRPLIIDDINTEPRFRGLRIEGSGIRSILSVPLLCKDTLIGVISLFNKKTGGPFTKDDLRLLSIIATQSAQVIENARLYEEEQQLRLIENELRMAYDIQMSLLPQETPEIEGMDIAGVSLPARIVGGDYYDFIKLDRDRLGVVIGDVSGKGIPAALLMSNIQATLRGQCLITPSVGECMSKANYLLHHCTDPEKFATLVYGIVDTKRGYFTYTNAGHNPPLLFDREGNWRLLDTGGIVLGMLEHFPYKEESIRLKTGDLIVMYSDGITEVMNEKEEDFGQERLIQLIFENRGLPSKKLLEKIIQRAKDFSKAVAQEDDMTAVVLKF